ncbi:hypothetical protein EJ08DRAFT_392230 [Tothia fuscella]|uniref:Uncharacterized protein n=1 Tax=Tothia fuscella TaxID=1048955 RepID=A0A9P4P1F7_9PEZI|nr:hypothetical protein EJ08DRAFT_392230 [Tothia fuscella]
MAFSPPGLAANRLVLRCMMFFLSNPRLHTFFEFRSRRTRLSILLNKSIHITNSILRRTSFQQSKTPMIAQTIRHYLEIIPRVRNSDRAPGPGSCQQDRLLSTWSITFRHWNPKLDHSKPRTSSSHDSFRTQTHSCSQLKLFNQVSGHSLYGAAKMSCILLLRLVGVMRHRHNPCADRKSSQKSSENVVRKTGIVVSMCPPNAY